jgi:phenylalanine-4-hydroxylase
MPNSSLESLPAYLRRYCAVQDYSKYTARDHAAWRYIMRQSRDYFRGHAVPIYIEGLRKTGIPIDRIPKVAEMDAALREFGWGAVPVCGFIPPIAFLDLQARGILPIATDMRSMEHIAYTPAPDIVHEAAGHAPIIADASYREYLRKYATMANKTIMSREDLGLYEAIRVLSDIKENPDTKPGEIELAQKELDRAVKNVSFVSEATKVSRMAWWTVEYGLVGPLKEPKIYGAGLLSSVGESQACLSARVRKIPLTVKCVETTYDITEPQPQLFVAESMDQLTDVLHDLEGSLSFKIGGVHGLEQARKAQTVNTVQLDTGLQISGILVAYEAAMHGERGEPHFIKFSGPTQICYGDKELSGQGRVRHPSGFSSPMGRWTTARHKSPSNLTDEELNAAGIRKGHRTVIDFVNGFRVQGVVQNIVRQRQKILYITWADCVVSRGAHRYFEPDWGEFDMPVGEAVTSVFGGPADREAFGEYEMGGVSTQPGRTSPFTDDERRIFDCYAKIRSLRQARSPDGHANLDVLVERVLSDHGAEWLLALEILELSKQQSISKAIETKVFETLIARADRSEETTAELITKGVRIADVLD